MLDEAGSGEHPRIRKDHMNYETIIVEKQGVKDRLTLRGTGHLNLMTPLMMRELNDYLGSLESDRDTRLVVISGDGDHFSGGLDIRSPLPVLDEGPDYAMNFMHDFGATVLKMRRCPQPIIALIRGAASGGGFALALASDIRIAGASARMNAAFVRLGLSGAEMGVSFLLPRLIGSAMASELCLTGRFVDAEEAFRLNLVSRVVPDEALEKTADDVAAEILANDAFAIRLTKETLNFSHSFGSLEAAIGFENRNQSLAFVGRSPREGVNAFRDKRKPQFK